MNRSSKTTKHRHKIYYKILLFFFKYMNIFIYFANISHYHFGILYFKYLQTLILCVTMFYKTGFYYNIFRGDTSNLAI